MKYKFTLILMAFSFLGFGQFETLNVTIINDQNNQSKHKNNTSTECGGDTLQYGRYKARSLRPITASLGYSLGQLYTAPGDVEISGFTFYAWFSGQNNFSQAKVFCHIYEIDSDSLPVGNPLRTDTLDVDTAFNGGQLALLERHANFATPITFNEPFIIVVGVVDSGRLAVVCNDWTNNEGRRENLLRGTVAGNTWYKGLNLNIAGAALDCDVLLEPHVKYALQADFNFDDCYDYRDTVRFTNASSGFIFDPMYNRWAFSNNTRISNMWNYGHNFSTFLSDDGEVKYNSPGNYTVRLINRLLHFKNNDYCYDTIEKPITFMPDLPRLSGVRIDSLCSGDSSIITASTNSDLFWFRGMDDTTFFQTGNNYRSGALFNSDTMYLEAKNGVCVTDRLEHIIKVNQIPEILSVSGDSVCTGAAANLSAFTDFGEIEWYSSVSGGSPFFIGDVYITSLLSSDLTVYAHANNSGCRSENRVSVSAIVGSEFAPDNPIIYQDSVACRKDGDFWLKVFNPTNEIRWFERPAGGSPLAVGDSFLMEMTPGFLNKTIYLDAFDGRCASTRVPVRVDFVDVPLLGININQEFEVCFGDSFSIDLKLSKGSAKWYEDNISNNEIFDGGVFAVNEVLSPISIFFAPYDRSCFDDTRYEVKINPIDFGLFNHTSKLNEVCENESAILEVDLILGIAKWYNDAELQNLVNEGNNYPIQGSSESQDFYVVADNNGCMSEPILYQLKVNPKADATFDFDILGPGNFRFSASRIGQGFYVWDLGDGNQGSGGQLTHQYRSNGSFDVSLVVVPNNECNDTFSRRIQVSGVVSVDRQNTAAIVLYPNPANNWIQIQLSDKNIRNAELIDLQGKRVKEFVINGEQTLSIADLTPGVYYLLIDGYKSHKIVKQ